MLRTLTVAALLTTLATLSAHAAPLFRLPDQPLETAAERLREKDYQAVLALLPAGQESGIRDLMGGEAAYQLERFDEAIPLLSAAAGRFHLLSDHASLRKAQALLRLNRYQEAYETALALQKDFPDSILAREAQYLAAESLYHLGKFPAAREACRSFVEKFPSGNDSLTASYLAAMALVRSGEPAKGALELRTIWLNHPASSIADDAHKALAGIAQTTALPSYTAEELFRRATTLYDLKKYTDSIRQMESIVTQDISADFKARIQLKLGQAQFRLRRYADAEQTLHQVDEVALKKEQRVELAYWRGRSLERNGKNNDAYGAYLRLATDSPTSELADNALFDAATIMKQQGKTVEAGQLFSRISQFYPDSTLVSRASWEAGWERLSAGDAVGAREHFNRLASAPGSRESGLYWLAKAQEAGGEKELAKEELLRLIKEFPFGYYALLSRKETGQPSPLPSIAPLDLAAEVPVPQGQERIKAMITLGFNAEARQELARLKAKAGSKPTLQRGIARLYLEMDDYAAAIRLFQRQGAKGGADASSPWGITYPLPFRSEVRAHAERNNLSRELVYAIIRAESSFSPQVVSPAGAIGLMQLMPATAHQMKPESSRKNVTSRLTLPDYNISLGTRHLRDLLNQYKGNEILAIAAYNAGASNVDRWVKTYGKLPQEAFIEQIPFAETREYVKKVLNNMDTYRNLYSKAPIALSTIPGNPIPAPATDTPSLHDDSQSLESVPPPTPPSPGRSEEARS